MSKRQHFHTFDALRFFSFLLVFFHHIPIPESSVFKVFAHSGGIGVIFFFVLSGFLITYILMYEKINKGKISLKKFFARRILRIWPLFYAMILFAFLTPYILDFLNLPYSQEGYEPNWLMSVLFLENYQMMLTDSFPNVSPLRVMWTLCIEEHFYIVWGIIIAVLPLKKIPYLIVASIILANISRVIYLGVGLKTADLLTNIDFFAFGAIPAYILVFRKDILQKVEKVPIQLKIMLSLIALFLVFAIPVIKTAWIDYFAPLIYGVFFSVTILFTLTQKNYLIIKDDFWFSKLGIFTYGLYLYHTIIISLFLKINQNIFYNNWFVFTIISLLATILVSILSYHLFEKQFLKLKVYFY